MRASPEELADIDAANARFRDEAQQLDLRFRCGDCAHVVPSAGDCSLGYPNGMLRGPIRAIDARGYWTFCKYFELD